MIPWEFLTIAFVVGGICFELIVGVVQSRYCADQAVDDNPSLWWRQQIELAKGRKAARELRKDGAR